jgi:capsular polysaccharide biosynthesis protein
VVAANQRKISTQSDTINPIDLAEVLDKEPPSSKLSPAVSANVLVAVVGLMLAVYVYQLRLRLVDLETVITELQTRLIALEQANVDQTDVMRLE